MKRYKTDNIGLNFLLYFFILPFFLLWLFIKLIILIIKFMSNKIKEKKYKKQIEPNTYVYNQNNYNENDNYSSIIKIDDIDESNNQNEKQQIIKYETKNLITNNEKYFYDIIEEHFGNLYKVQTQVYLASIVNKIKKFDNEWQNELNRSIDFGIFNKETLEPLLLIEINDSTHQQPKRIQRDIRVKEICEEAGIKLIKFYTYMSNTQQYIVNRISKELQNIDSSFT